MCFSQFLGSLIKGFRNGFSRKRKNNFVRVCKTTAYRSCQESGQEAGERKTWSWKEQGAYLVTEISQADQTNSSWVGIGLGKFQRMNEKVLSIRESLPRLWSEIREEKVMCY